jgi:tetratricopeptide (TPR) repeat protein
MQRWMFAVLLLFGFGLAARAQSSPDPAQKPSERDVEAGASSSRDTRIDLSPPKDDTKNHPDSAVSPEGEGDTSDVKEMHPWNPHRALKDIEVGDYYLKRKNYRAALDRYREALLYKPNDALANYHMAECYEKLKDTAEAAAHYEEYLKILPNGPLAEEARKSLARLKPAAAEAKEQPKP